MLTEIVRELAIKIIQLENEKRILSNAIFNENDIKRIMNKIR